MEDELRRNQEEMTAMQETWQQKMAEREKEFQVRGNLPSGSAQG